MESYDINGKSSRNILLKGIKNKVLNYNVIRGYAPLNILTEISDSETYQRKIIDEHAEEIKRYLDKGRNCFFPEIILGLTDKAETAGILVTEESPITKAGKHYDQETNIVSIKIPLAEKGEVSKDVQNSIVRIDGNHRLNNGLEFTGSDKIVSFCIVDLRNGPDVGGELIFYLINKKVVPLTNEENLNAIISDEKQVFTDIELKEDDNALIILKYLNEIISKDRTIYENLKEKYLTKLYNISETICNSTFNVDIYNNPELLKKDITYLFEKVEALYIDLSHSFQDIECLNYIVPLITHVYLLNSKDYNESKELLTAFLMWVERNKLFSVNYFEYNRIWDIFYEIYSNKEYKIFVSMPFGSDLASKAVANNIYSAISQAVGKVKEKYKIPLKTVRVDIDHEGYSEVIFSKILSEIKTSDLLIADITGSNANVFNEIGYMMGLCTERGIYPSKIILIMNKDDQNTKFNLKGIHRISFNDFKYLENELYERISKIYENSNDLE